MQEHSGAVAAVREFNRFYTNVIGLLRGKYLDSPYSLTEARLLFELGRHETSEVTDLRRVVDIDAGYLSRILARFDSDGLITRQRSDSDGRRQVIRPTEAGRSAIARLDASSDEQTGQLLEQLPGADQRRLLDAMRTITELLTPAHQPRAYVLREPRPGDMGWVVQRHGEFYAAEYGWDERFEALVAEIVAEFVAKLDPAHERCWITERDGENVGSVFLVKKSASSAKLRLLLVEPSARGLGIGKRLVAECVRFARQAGYRKIRLWTQSELAAARGIYQDAGFKLVREEKHSSWSRKDLVAETWELKL